MSGLHPAEEHAREAAQRRDATLALDPARRKAHGVVHTPPELARGVIGILDALLTRELGLAGGACDPRVQFIDPACGPGAFVAAELRLWAARGRPPGLRVTGFDLDATALASAQELAVHAPDAFALHCTDVLREPRWFERAAAKEAKEAKDRVLAIAGNPPWATARADKTPEMQASLEAFRCDELGVRLPEKKLGVLSDAYVRFFRACAEAARRSEHGAAVALVTNGSFLDGPVHRGMRAALLRWFDTLHVLDLGGSALLQRTAAGERARDDNVFGVRPSVTITWLCRRPGPEPRAGRVWYARAWGTTAQKLAAVGGGQLDGLGFEELQPEQPARRFVPGRPTATRYAGWPSLADWMPFHREGVQTNRDRAAVDRDPARLLERLHAFARGLSVPELAQANTDSAHYAVQVARRNVAEALERDPDGARGISIRPLAYRPFDPRWFCPVAPLCHRPRPELLRAIAHEPRVLVSVRKDRGSTPYAHFGAADSVIDNCFLSTRSSCRARAFPARTPEGEPNLSSLLAAQCSERVGALVTAREFQRYALAFLASDAYRDRYDAELHADYPRLPLPRSAEDYRALVALGSEIESAWLEPAPMDGAAQRVTAPAGSGGAAQGVTAPAAADGGGLVRAAAELEPALAGMWIGHFQPLRAAAESRPSSGGTLPPEVSGVLWRVQRMRRALLQVSDWLREAGHV